MSRHFQGLRIFMSRHFQGPRIFIITQFFGAAQWRLTSKCKVFYLTSSPIDNAREVCHSIGFVSKLGFPRRSLYIWTNWSRVVDFNQTLRLFLADSKHWSTAKEPLSFINFAEGGELWTNFVPIPGGLSTFTTKDLYGPMFWQHAATDDWASIFWKIWSTTAGYKWSFTDWSKIRKNRNFQKFAKSKTSRILANRKFGSNRKIGQLDLSNNLITKFDIWKIWTTSLFIGLFTIVGIWQITNSDNQTFFIDLEGSNTCKFRCFFSIKLRNLKILFRWCCACSFIRNEPNTSLHLKKWLGFWACIVTSQKQISFKNSQFSKMVSFLRVHSAVFQLWLWPYTSEYSYRMTSWKISARILHVFYNQE